MEFKNLSIKKEISYKNDNFNFSELTLSTNHSEVIDKYKIKNKDITDKKFTDIKKIEDLNNNSLIIDARFNYEFKGGNIKNSINIFDPFVISYLFKDNFHLLSNQKFLSLLKIEKEIINLKLIKLIVEDFNNNDKIRSKINKDLSIIIYCEFGLKRSVKIYDLIRKFDRERNIYPQLDFSNLLVLKGGYFSLYNLNKNLPYISMFDKMYKKEYSLNYYKFNNDIKCIYKKDDEINKKIDLLKLDYDDFFFKLN